MKNFFINTKGQAQPTETIPVTSSAFEPTGKTEITWLGNAGVLINARGTTILIDPLLMGFDMPLLFDIPLKPEDIPELDGYLVTHIDNDHCSTETIEALIPVCKSYHATQYVAGEMRKTGAMATGHDIGESFKLGSMKVTLTPAKHDWQKGLPDFAYHDWKEEDYCGFWFDTPDGSIWLPGDSTLLDCHLAMPAPDVILYDFSDSEWHITFEGAVKLANAYPDAKLICIHWGTVESPVFTPFNGNPAKLFERVINPCRICVLLPGETMTL